MSSLCKWCGDASVVGSKQLCKTCKDMNTEYTSRIGHMFHTTDLAVLLRFRNMCMDLINFRERGGTDLPYDLDYQLDRVNRYINEK